MTLRPTRRLIALGTALAALAWLACGPEGRDRATDQGAAVSEVVEPAAPAPGAPSANPIEVDGSASLGPADAPVTLVEFSDFQ